MGSKGRMPTCVLEVPEGGRRTKGARVPAPPLMLPVHSLLASCAVSTEVKCSTAWRRREKGGGVSRREGHSGKTPPPSWGKERLGG